MRTRVRFISLMLASLGVACGDQPTEVVPEREMSGTPGVIAAATSASDDGRSITTDKDDYAPGDTVWFTGAGWQPEDVLDIVLNDEPATHPPHTWSVATGADGTFRDSTYVVDVGDLGVTFNLTATSRATGQSLSVTFTDGTLRFISSAVNLFTSVTYSRWNSSSDCGLTGTAIPNATNQSLAYNAGLGVNNGQSIRVTIPTVSGHSYQGYSVGGGALTVTPASGPTNTTICVTGFPPSEQRTITLIYSAGTTTELVSSQNPSTFGQPVTFTATVKSGSPAAAIGANGAVTFRTGGSSCSDAVALPNNGPANPNPAPLNSSGQATYATSALPVGTTKVWACYGGTTVAPLYSASFTSLDQVVNPAGPAATSTTVTTSDSPSIYGDAVTFTATVKKSSDNSAVTVGSVSFKLGGSSCTDAAATDLTGATNPADLDGTGKATFTTSSLPASATAHVIRACYGGTTDFAPSGNTVNQTVNPRPIKVKANDAAPIVYGTATPTSFGYTLTGNFIGSDETAFAATLSYTLSGTENSDGFLDVGTYTITPSWTYSNTNYAISLASPGTGSLSVTPRPISVKANDAGPIEYGDALPTFGVTLTGTFVGSDQAAFTATLSYVVSGTPNGDGFRNVGNYTITPSWTYSNDNYSITLASPGTGMLTIEPRAVAIKANDAGPIVYGTAAPTSFSYTLTGNFMGGDEADFAATLSYAIGGVVNGDGFLNVGSYPITPSWTYSNGNYAISLTTPKGMLTVTERPVTVRANDAGSIYYADPTPTFTWSIVSGSFVGSDEANFEAAVSFQLSPSTPTPLPVGDYTISLVGYSNSNYNITRETGSLTVLAWSLHGFYQPVDMSANNSTIFNTVKGGSTVPLKFEIFGSSERTATADVNSFVQAKVSCPNAPVLDQIEITSTGGTHLRYDAVAGQFVQNWQTPKQPGACYKVKMTTQDGSSLIAYFLLK